MAKLLLRAGTALLCAVLAVSFAHRVFAQMLSCPCTIWPASALPANAAVSDGQPIEIGVKVRSDIDGFVTAIRFYKGALNTGTHVGHLWSTTGTLLAAATFAGETSEGWQEAQLSPPVPISANTTYIASYHSESGYFAFDNGFFSTAGVDAPPLHALQSGVDGPNGVFVYGPSAFPTGGGSNNYWVDLVLKTDLGPDVTPPSVTSVTPADGATAVALSSAVRATFSEAMIPVTISPFTFELRTVTGAPVFGTTSYDASTRTATFSTTAGLLPGSIYTARVVGAPSGVSDLAGNQLETDKIWSFTTGTPAPPPDEGPGGPILVLSSLSNPFSRYYAEILRAEGLNEFTVSDISAVTAATLSSYDVVLLGEMPLSAPQVAMLSDYVLGGGNLVAMRPDKQLAALLGLTDDGSYFPDAYLQIDTSSQPGAGIVGETIQYHGAADLYSATGAATIATLFADASTTIAKPAVTLAAAGSNGGRAAAFTYDLARSIVYTRQGNPAWSAQERDAISPIRSDDLFFGAAAGDPQPDWVDLTKVAIPQADEQQRLLANLILYLNRTKKPLPRFWYLPHGLKAAIVMTGDDHGNGGTVGRFNQFKSLSAPGCSVADWQCIRSTSYIYNGTPGMDNVASLGFVNDGFEVALHVSSNCANWSPASLATFYSSQLAQFHAERPDVPPPQTNRTHCIAWSDYVTQPKVELANGIRFDTNYYFYPQQWVQDRPGLFTGSAMPMRFADLDGSTINVYQATTQMTDESGQTYPFTADTLLDRALGPLGYYGVFTANHHTDQPTEQPSDATVASAIARNVPVVSAKQILDWLDGRNSSSFGSIAWNAGTLGFTIAPGATANGLMAMVPTQAMGGALTGMTQDGMTVNTIVELIKGVEYAFFPAAAGSYLANYMVDTTPPVISGVTATPGAGDTATIAWTTNEPADSRVDFGTDPSSLTMQAGSSQLVTSHAITLNGLQPLTTYYFSVASTDAAGNSAATPAASFTMPAATFTATDTTAADFGAGTPSGTYVSQTSDGEVILAPLAGSEFFGTALPADWSMTAWTGGGTATVSGGLLSVDGARAGTIATYPAGRSLEFVATFSGVPFQHVGFGDTLGAPPWAVFSTFNGNGLFARTDSGAASLNTALPAGLIGSPHRFRIDWTSGGVVYSVDGAIVATHAIAIADAMRPIATNFLLGVGLVTVDWLRMSPYASSGTFESRIFDAGTAVNWGALSWNAQAPAGTSTTFLVRLGNTPVPDATWTPFAAVPASGTTIGGSSRYLQYRTDLTSGDPAATPSVESVTILYSTIQENQPPVAVDDNVAATESTPLTVAAPGVLANDTDADSDPLAVILVSGPSHGSVTLQADGGFSYAPAAGFFGVDSFTYRANDGQADSNVATVSIAVQSTNRPPVAAGDSYSTNQNTPLTIATPGVLANDTDADGDPLTAVLVAGPSHGSVALESSGAFTYTPATAFVGTDSFTYKARDPESDSNVAMVSIAVASTNHLPVANPDAYSTNQDTPLTVAVPGVLANDTDADGDVLTAILVGGQAHGTVVLQASGGFTYTPAVGFSGSDSFLYKASDGKGDSSVATVSIAVAAANHLPIAAADSYATNQNTPLVQAAPGVLANDTDADGDALSAVLVAGPSHGTVVLQSNGSFTYTPASGFFGADSFTYKANDGHGDSNVATVSIAVASTGHPPQTAPDTYSTNEDTQLKIFAPGVLANDHDPLGRTMTAVLVSGPQHGTLISFSTSGSFTYKPALNFNGSDSFVYRAVAGPDHSVDTPVTLTVVPVNDAPVAKDDIYRSDQFQTLNVAAPGILANDTDVDGNTLTAVLISSTSKGKLTFHSDGSFTYKSYGWFDGTDSFTYKASDGLKKSTVATVTITGLANHRGFVAQPDDYTMAAGTVLSLDAPGVLVNDLDPDGESLTAVLVSGPSHGTLTLNEDGSLIYIPEASFTGVDSFIYRAQDEVCALTPPTIVTITVQ